MQEKNNCKTIGYNFNVIGVINEIEKILFDDIISLMKHFYQMLNENLNDTLD